MIRLSGAIGIVLTIFVSLGSPDIPTIVCPDSTSQEDISIPTNLDGITYFHVDTIDNGKPMVPTINRLTSHGVKVIETPLPPDTTILYTRLSPDGRVLAFSPFGDNSELYVWDTLTDQIASVELTTAEREQIEVTVRQDFSASLLVFRWSTPDRIGITMPAPAGEFRSSDFAVTLNPLSISRVGETVLSAPSLPGLDADSILGFSISPTERYTTILNDENIPELLLDFRLRVYDNISQEVVVDLPSSRDFSPLSNRGIWLEEGFILRYSPDVNENDRLVWIDVATGTMDTRYQDIIDSMFLTDARLSHSPLLYEDMLVVSASGVPVDTNFPASIYLFFIDTQTSEVTVYCNPELVQRGSPTVPFFTPDGNYFGYMTGSRLAVYDVTTGEAYRLPYSEVTEYMGWGQAPCDSYVDAGDVLSLTNSLTQAASQDVYVICVDGIGSFNISASLPSVTSNVTIYGRNTEISVTNTGRVFDISATGSLTLENITLTGGNAGMENGGAIRNAGNLTLRNVTLTDNSAANGGAIYNTGTLVIEGGELRGNTASAQGGAIWTTGDYTITDSLLIDNLAVEASAIYKVE